MNYFIVGKNIYGKSDLSDFVVLIKESDKNILDSEQIFNIEAIKLDLATKQHSPKTKLAGFIEFNPFMELESEEERKDYEEKIDKVFGNNFVMELFK
jgi:hypothetical protein